MEDFLFENKGAEVFSKIDLRAGYQKIRVLEAAKVDKTALRVHNGHFEYKVMPFPPSYLFDPGAEEARYLRKANCRNSF